ncbi:MULTISPECIES: hypothetical protein [unclassified Anaeromyxobacter]|uniref:hypothetical protein n=1 Tax=unclassified Anaeromyxobacter TaxID=2620896 RepID=UPI001F56D280|nr:MULTISPECIES: hypothetical protein [unclassified Anaeromyxobacter]
MENKNMKIERRQVVPATNTVVGLVAAPIQRAAEARGHGGQTAMSGIGAMLGGLLGSFAGPIGAVVLAGVFAGIGYEVGREVNG